MKLRITKLFILTIIFQATIGEQFVVEDGPYGGNGGISWTDGSGVNLNGDITAMEIRSHSRVDAIRVRYGDTWGEWHGGNGGELYSFELNPGATINIVQGRSKSEIDAIEFISSDGMVYGPYGGSGGNPFVSARPNCKLSYLSGKSQDRTDSLTLHYEC